MRIRIGMVTQRDFIDRIERLQQRQFVVRIVDETDNKEKIKGLVELTPNKYAKIVIGGKSYFVSYIVNLLNGRFISLDVGDK